MMKLLKVFAVVFLAVMLTGSWASAQESDLPSCPPGDDEYWHNCFSTWTNDVGKYVGEWRDNKWHGQGTLTSADGRIEKGIWYNNRLVEDVLTDAIDRCLFENIDKITSDAAERVVKKKCEQELRDLSINELKEAYN